MFCVCGQTTKFREDLDNNTNPTVTYTHTKQHPTNLPHPLPPPLRSHHLVTSKTHPVHAAHAQYVEGRVRVIIKSTMNNYY